MHHSTRMGAHLSAKSRAIRHSFNAMRPWLAACSAFSAALTISPKVSVQASWTFCSQHVGSRVGI